jgi:hypothetical protein
MRMPRSKALVLPLLIACSGDSGVTASRDSNQRKPMEEPSFSLSPVDREHLTTMHYDPDAVEQLLARIPAESRVRTLQTFLGVEHEGNRGSSRDGTQPDLSVLYRISDPSMQELLDRAWAPRWRAYSLQTLEQIKADLPGLKVAIRDARRRQKEDQ